MSAPLPAASAHAYLEVLGRHLEVAYRRNAEAIDLVSVRVADSVRKGGIVHLFGCGHSQLVALEVCDRAGGLASLRAIADPALAPTQGARATLTERLEGYGSVVLDTEDLRPGEVLVVISNSGINPVPIDVAAGAAARGLYVVAVTSRLHSDAVTSRHPAGTRLHEVAAITLDTGTPAGDASVQTTDGASVGPLSTIVASALLHAVFTAVSAQLADAGDDVPVLRSRNLDGPADPNAPVLARYADRRR